MPELLENISLQPFNTFGVKVNTRYFLKFDKIADLQDIINKKYLQKKEFLILGGGSNYLFTEDFQGIVLHPEIKGKEIVGEDENCVYLKVGAGEDWDDLVKFSVENNCGGLENLSLIPGNVGACPVQNIGAYGVEVKDVITEVETVNLKNGEIRVFSNQECRFGYRDSIFKNELKNCYVVTRVIFRLEKNPRINVTYGRLCKLFDQADTEIKLRNVRDAVIKVRQEKLPDPEILGNAGSFFKNPVVSMTKAEELLIKYPGIPHYPFADKVKLAAGWLIDQAGWKGYRQGNVGVHENQALVLVNYGKATGKEILHLADKIKTSVSGKFTIRLEPEVNIV
jgi:UDP-N-acetylmuramate dehydrogenase